MKKDISVIFALFLILFFSTTTEIFCQETNSIYIKVYEDGSALWNLETKFELKSQKDIDFFNDYMGALEEDKDFILQKKKESLQNIINTVAYASGREMSIENISLNYQIIDSINRKYGVVNIKFLWKGFCLKDKDTIEIGDVFINDTYLKEGELFVLEFPEEYQVVNVSPEPSEKREKSILWYGPKILLENEPKIILERKSIISSFNILIFGFVAILSILLLGIIYFRINKRKKTLPILVSEEEKVTNILRSYGGKCFQNDIVFQSGLSKSKISQIISEMEKKGLITKKRYGKNNLIELS